MLPAQADCRQAADCDRVMKTVSEAFGDINILVNNDGAPPLGEISGFDDVAWQKAMEQNFMYVVRMTRGVLPHMQKSGGSILNITAISAIQPIAKFGLSVASWGAVIGFAKTLSLEWRPMALTSTPSARVMQTRPDCKRCFRRAPCLHSRCAKSLSARCLWVASGQSQMSLASSRYSFPARQLRHRHGDPGRRRSPARGPLGEDKDGIPEHDAAGACEKIHGGKTLARKDCFRHSRRACREALNARRRQRQERRHHLRGAQG